MTENSQKISAKLSDSEIKKLIKISKDMCDRAYCPYSKFPVGAALLCENGKIITGCNVENASYGLSNCAERTAIFNAVSEGLHKFKAIAISSHREDYTWPCGACRQVLSEFGLDWDVYVTKPDESYVKSTVGELLPNTFQSYHLGGERKLLLA